MSDKLEKMAAFLANVNKSYKKKYNADVIYYGDKLTDFMPFKTGFPSFDWGVSGIGGFPRGGMTLIHGAESSGKSTFTLDACSFMQLYNPEETILYIDIENSLTKSFLSFKNIVGNRIGITSLNTEDALNIAENAIKDDIFDAIVMDSLAKIDSNQILAKEIGESQQRNRRAVILTEFLRRITYVLRKSNTALVCINQETQNQDPSPWAPKTVLPGGKQQLFTANLRIELKRNKSVKVGDRSVGYEMTMTAKKNKVAAKEKCFCKMLYLYDRGFVREYSLIDYLVAIGHLKELSQKRYEFSDKTLYDKTFKLGEMKRIAEDIRNRLSINLYDIEPTSEITFGKEEGGSDVGVEEGDKVVSADSVSMEESETLDM